MYVWMVIIALFVASLDNVSSRRKIEDYAEAFECHAKCSDEFNCACEDENWMSAVPQCIPFRWLCDAEQDCSNKADEMDCECPSDEHQCGSTLGGAMKRLSEQYNCISEELVDNGKWDCWNGSDESDNRACVDPVQCDGYLDCRDGADEANCTRCPSNLPHRCACNKPSDFTCREGYTCYSDEVKCDGYSQCSDGSDEEVCNCTSGLFTCSCYGADPKSCSSGGCIPSIWICDGDFDCNDGTDEKSCSCRDDQFTCACYMSQPKSCLNRGCISTKWKCDGKADCDDGSDEEDCETCRDDQFTCDCFQSNSTKPCSGKGCISKDGRCDGRFDCSDESDEMDCPSCREDLFTCGCYKNDPKSCDSIGCIPSSEECDGDFDCSDNSDEEGCKCGVGLFTCDCYDADPKTCSGAGCLSMDERCDGNFTCSDGSDETNCTCKEGQLPCDCYQEDPKSCPKGDRGCFSRSQRCDGTFDCSDRSDDANCSCELEFTCDCYKNKSCSIGGIGCVSRNQTCDGTFHCSDGSDETNCTCHDNQFTCNCNKGNSTSCSKLSCIPSTSRCDGKLNCEDGSDEESCPCTDDQFTCDCYKNESTLCSGERCISAVQECDGEEDCDDDSDESNCTTCKKDLFTCDCYKNNTCSKRGCLPMKQRCDAFPNCEDHSDETNCSCEEGQFTCGCYNNETKSCFEEGCVLMTQRCDGERACEDDSDEEGCTDCRDGLFTCHCYKNESCSRRGCVPNSWLCDGEADCEDNSDEENCTTCRDDQFTCACLTQQPQSCPGEGCVPIKKQCDGEADCLDSSDENNCTLCRDGLFTCNCYRRRDKRCITNGCIPISKVGDGKKDCDDGSDEPSMDFKATKYKAFDVIIRRFTAVELCDDYIDCDNSTCVNISGVSCTDHANCSTKIFICISKNEAMTLHSQPDLTIFQCENGHLEIAHNFCDGNTDCSDRSDEEGIIPGFKCSASFGRCVLPQRNLYDRVAQCKDESDLCLNNSCFKCFDGRLMISQTQVCDGKIDCFDLSDECLCDVYLGTSVCEEMFPAENTSSMQCEKLNPQCCETTSHSVETARFQTQRGLNKSKVQTSSQTPPTDGSSSNQLSLHIRCSNKRGPITATTCDDRPECRDFSDECLCPGDRPRFCDDGCHDFYPIGDRYCDGIKDEAWKYIKNSSCPEGFDEKSCPQRFKCKSRNFSSVDRVKVCDGKNDCDDESDETNCTEKIRGSIFSSTDQMIANVELRVIFWIMSFVVILGNSIVIFPTARLLCKEKMSECQKFNHIVILNLSMSDFLMGIYLLLISVKSVQYSGFYGKIDSWWRNSIECSIIGSIAVISSETSCFVMTILTAFRLYNVFNPFTARTASTLKWKLMIVLAWLVSLVLALLPVSKATSNYFVHEIWLSNIFTSTERLNKTDVTIFTCRLAGLSNRSFGRSGEDWESTARYLHKNFPDYSINGEIGYYGETSVCMPRIYASSGDQAWLYSLVIITFNFASFLFVAISYLLIYFKASNRPIQNSKADEQSAQMQKRIARLIATDFACWIPICIMVYLKTGGVEINDVVYIVTAGVLLPINSALNPLLYSPIVERFLRKLCCNKRRSVRQNIKLINLR